MDDVKDKMKGFMKNLTTSNSKFKGQGHVLGSSSSASNLSNSRLIPPQNPNPNPKPKPKPNPKPSPSPNPKPSNEFSPFDPLITTSNRSANDSSSAVFNCPICSSSFSSESEVSDHIDLCLTTANSNAETPIESSIVAESVSLYLSNQPRKDLVDVVLRLLSNVAKEPGNEKFRRIRMGNPKIKEAVSEVKGGVELLEILGFRIGEEEGGEVWGMMEAPTEDGVRVIKEAVSLLERWKEGGLKEDESASNGVVEEDRVIERKKMDRKWLVPFGAVEVHCFPVNCKMLKVEIWNIMHGVDI
ncbi:plant UBX domain-containing protein 2-like, partial [Asparagus officinalis]|uniref:plant UBX domain-containing protein 2-like n=1 Tax=Asparagus officinalis TaxID=4686 RepID=UPI00098DFF06